MSQQHKLDLANFHETIGQKAFFKEEYDKAIKEFTKSLEIKKQILPEKHEDIVRLHMQLGAIYSHKKDWKQFFQYMNATLEMLEENHSFMTEIYNRMGIVYNITGQYDKSVENLLKSVQVMEIIYNFNR
jgi:lipopolysaccharide biosynthesis regulator YciM